MFFFNFLVIFYVEVLFQVIEVCGEFEIVVD